MKPSTSALSMRPETLLKRVLLLPLPAPCINWYTLAWTEYAGQLDKAGEALGLSKSAQARYLRQTRKYLQDYGLAEP